MQFGITSIYHFFFVPLTIGLTLLVAIMETQYVRTKNEIYKDMTKFWGKLMLINFAMGVVTGIVQEFHFGMAWSGFSRFIGDVLGAPLASEALIAFFAESTFLGFWIFGWERLSRKAHLAAIWVVAVATVISSFWILLVNSFMQEPVGYVIRNGRAEMESFFALVTNHYLWLQLPHTVASGITTAAMFVLGISCFHLMNYNNTEFFKKSFKMGMIAGFIGLVIVIGFGDLQGKYLVKAQPMKMAAAEALWESKDPAPFSVISVIDEKEHKNLADIEVPKLLSFMALGKFEGKVPGINDIQKLYEQKYGPGDYIPPVWISYISFRIMLICGILMLLLVLVAMFVYWRYKLDVIPLYFQLMIFIIPLPYLANTFGWILTEMGRQPWVVFGLLKTGDAVSKNVSPNTMLVSMLSFLLVYGLLAVIDVFLLFKFARQGVGEAAPAVNFNNRGREGSMWI